jgi:ribosome-binding factor A
VKYERKRRVNEALRQVLARGVEELADPAIGFVTVTSVDVTRDLEHATVFVSVLGGEKRRQSALRGLERAHGVLQARVARELHLRRTPQLTFHYDGGVDRAMRITELLDESGEVAGEGPDGSETDERT